MGWLHPDCIFDVLLAPTLTPLWPALNHSDIQTALPHVLSHPVSCRRGPSPLAKPEVMALTLGSPLPLTDQPL